MGVSSLDHCVSCGDICAVGDDFLFSCGVLMKDSFWNNTNGWVVYEFGWGFLLSTIVFLVVISVPLGMTSWYASQRLASVGVALVGEVVANYPPDEWESLLNTKWDYLVGSRQRFAVQVIQADNCLEDQPGDKSGDKLGEPFALATEWIYDGKDATQKITTSSLPCSSIAEEQKQQGTLMVRGFGETSWLPLVRLFPPGGWFSAESMVWIRGYGH